MCLPLPPLPSSLLQEVPFTQILKPLVALQRPTEGASRWSNHPLTRLAVLAAISGLLVRLYAHSPDKGEYRVCVGGGGSGGGERGWSWYACLHPM